MRFDVRGVNHLRARRSSVPGKLPEQVFPDTAPGPSHKPVINRCRGTIFGRAVAPAAAASQNVHDTTDDAAIICSLYAAHIRRQVRFDPLPLIIGQPK
jgi:hypothetical protein